MTRFTFSRMIGTPLLVLLGITLLGGGGCSTAPKQQDEATVVADAESTLTWFKNRVPGLDRQLDTAGGYTVFPGIGQYGLLISGGKFGRGVVYDANDEQIGWSYLNTVSAGLQVGAQGFKMIIVFEDPATLGRFKEHKLTGDASATAVAAEAGKSGMASFSDGVAVYQGGNTGLMAGASIGLDYIRYEALPNGM